MYSYVFFRPSVDVNDMQQDVLLALYAALLKGQDGVLHYDGSYHLMIAQYVISNPVLLQMSHFFVF